MTTVAAALVPIAEAALDTSHLMESWEWQAMEDFVLPPPGWEEFQSGAAFRWSANPLTAFAWGPSKAIDLGLSLCALCGFPVRDGHAPDCDVNRK